MDHFDTELPFTPQDSKNYLFFKHIYKKLGPDFISSVIRKKASESRGHFNESMQRYFENFILMEAVSKCIDSSSEVIDKQESLTSQTSTKVISAGSHPLYLNAIKLHTQQGEISKELQLYGIDREFISKVIESKKNQKEELRLKTLVENYILEFCKQIINVSGCYDVPTNNRSTFEKTMKELSSRATLLVAGKAILYPKETDVQEMLSTYYKELTEGLSMLHQLIALYKEKQKFELGLAQFYSQKCEALYLKVRIFEMKVLLSTYSKETIQALNIISGKLDEKEERLLKERDDKKTTLQAYQILGPKYDDLVKEYTELTKDIMKQKWTIKTLNETKDR